MIFLKILPLIIGFVIDLLVGDPPGLPHPIRLIGWLISRLEKVLRRIFPDTAAGKRTAGLFLAIIVPLLMLLFGWGVLHAAYRINFWAGFVLESILTWQILATCCLKQETNKVFQALHRQDLPDARQKLAWLVGRDTAELSETAVIRGAVETIAENTNDGVIAPLFYMALGGVPLALAYKAINTLDSMVGYKNEKYLDFGRYSAKLDDVANFIPARLAALIMFLGSVLLGFPAGRTWATFLRDRYKHSSPNSAQTESVCAGALGIQLGGSNSYFGRVVAKPTIGDYLRDPVAQDIRLAQKQLYMTAAIGLLLFLPIRIFCLSVIGLLGG